MSGLGSPDEPTYLASSPAGGAPRRPASVVGGVAVIVVLVAGIVAAVLLSRDGGDDVGEVATATTDQPDGVDGDGAGDSTADSATDGTRDTVAPDIDGEPIAALVPGDTLVDEWEIRSVREEPEPDLAGDLIVAPAGSTVDTEQAVSVTVYPDKYLDPRSDDAVEVSLGGLQGFYSARDDGIASLLLGDGELALEMSAAPGTPLETLTELAKRVDIHAPIDTLDPGPGWQVVASSAEIRPEAARRVKLGAIDGRAELTVLIYDGVDESAMSLLALPYVTRPVEVRGHEAFASTALGSLQGASMYWMEGPEVFVSAWILSYPEGHDVDQALLAITEELVVVDVDGWDEFVKAQQPLPIPDDPQNYTPAEGEILGELADGRTYLMADVPGEGICLLIDWEERGCETWRPDEDPLEPIEVRADEGWDTVLIYGYLPDGADTVTVEWKSGLEKEATRGVRVPPEMASTSGTMWAAVVPPNDSPFMIHFYDGPASNDELVASAMNTGGLWATRVEP